MMNSQEIFDTVLSGLRRQGKASLKDDGDKCMYRGAGGTKCAAGLLIRDEEYHRDMEGLTFSAVVMHSEFKHTKWFSPERIALFRTHAELIYQLQYAHDTDLKFRGVEYWEQAMAKIARDFGLQYTPRVPEFVIKPLNIIALETV